ncbi:MAG: alpha-hydroxy-acid oxidizing protein [Actinobacteria bacterium]|nr:alpha-hydroxy-acid oxidizing protein [Actinomycetota bacterium]
MTGSRLRRRLPPLRLRDDFINIADARQLARRALPRTVFDFFDGGATDEVTLRDNRRSFDELMFRPKMGCHIADPALATTVVGQPVAAPILFAPCGMLGTAFPGAEPAIARVANRVGTIAAHSTYASSTVEEIAAAAPAGRWFQLYFLGGRAGAESLIDRARAAGYETLVVTVDTAVPGRRERDERNGVTYPITVNAAQALHFGPQVLARPGWLWRFAAAGFPVNPANARRGDGHAPIDAATLFEAPPTWADLAWIREAWDGPLVVKGVLGGSDARRAVDAGADAVVVSNHGGRQLDGVPGAVRVLPEVVRAVGADVEVLVDGGIERGADVAKALALGARAVLIGRAYIWGLAVGGEAGAERVWKLLVDELTHTLRLLGVESAQQLDAAVLTTATALAKESGL